MSVKIAQLEIENAKRVKAVAFSPAAIGLTLIGGNNCQGKTSILDTICYSLGGEKYRPSNLQRKGAESEAYSKIVLSNGIVVERKGKNAALKVTDPSGMKAGQKLLDDFIEELALNLPKFLQMNAKEKANILLSILGIEQQLKAIDEEEKAAYDERTVWGRVADQKEKYAAELPFFEDAPAIFSLINFSTSDMFETKRYNALSSIVYNMDAQKSIEGMIGILKSRLMEKKQNENR